VLRGTVVSHQPYGYFVNFGRPFLALADISSIPRDEEFPAVGSSIEAKVLGFSEDSREIYIARCGSPDVS
jgi:DNA-directed RNA polymerase subunit E'/Rpb7